MQPIRVVRTKSSALSEPNLKRYLKIRNFRPKEGVFRRPKFPSLAKNIMTTEIDGENFSSLSENFVTFPRRSLLITNYPGVGAYKEHYRISKPSYL